MNIKIRPATPEDLTTLKEFEQGLIDAERPFDTTIRKHPVQYYDLEKLIPAADCNVLIATVDDEIVACGMVLIAIGRPYLNHSDYANIRFLYTKPEHRGRGINAMIINQLITWAHEQNLFEIRLTVYQNNIPAIKAYEKVGFKKHIIEMRLP